MIGPALFSTVFEVTIDPKGKWYWPGAPFALAAAVLAVALILALVTIPSAKNKSNTHQSPA